MWAQVDARTDEQKEAARTLVGSGHDKLAAGDYDAALEDFRRADDIMGVPTTGLLVGIALSKRGRLVEARDELRDVANMPPVDDEPEAFARARAEASERVEALTARISRIAIDVRTESGPLAPSVPLTIVLDGEALTGPDAERARDVDPGAHVVRVRADGYVPVELSVQIDEGKTLVRSVTLMKVSIPSREESDDVSPWAVAAYTSFVTSGAGLAVGIVTGALSLDAAGEVESLCPELSACGDEARPAHDRSIALANASNAAFAVAGVAAAVGVVTLVVSFDGDEEGARAQLRLTPNAMVLEGRF